MFIVALIFQDVGE